MAALEHKGMVVVDGVRWPLELLEEKFPEKVKDAVPVRDAARDGAESRVDTVPGGVVTGETKLGAPVVDTTESAAGNGVIVDADVPGESGGPGDEGSEAGKRPQRRAGTKK